VEPRVLLITFDPACRPRGGVHLVQACGFNDPAQLTQGYVEDLAEVSGGYLRYRVVDEIAVDGFPIKADGFAYDAADYLACWERGGGWHEPDLFDYAELVRRFDLARRVKSGEVDEVWLWGPPYTGFWESTMIGRGAYFCNSAPLELPDCRRFVVMGFNYERGVGEMLEDFGHRVESVMSHVFGSWRTWGGHAGHAWDEFTAYDLVAPGKSGCGNVHFAPNSQQDYEWGNLTPVWSNCDRWPSYPHGEWQPRLVDCREWGGGDIRAHHRWWLAHLPRGEGETRGVRNNWWSYVVEC
jgi:hypothetical protein